MKKTLLLGVLLTVSLSAYAQNIKAIKVITANKNKGQLLNTFFPIDNIVSIKITNNNGAHVLTMNELRVLKSQLKQAKFAGGLLIKPNHITLDIKLIKSGLSKPGFVYASTGAIHFEDAVDRFKQEFSGTFYLPTKLNFDNYKDKRL